MKRKRLSLVPIVIIFFAGIAIMVYPFFSNWWNHRNQGVIINEYDDAVKDLDQESIDAEWAAAREYNENLLGNVILTDPFDASAEKRSTEEYEARLNLTDNDIMGYITIPQINVKLAIYHGTSSHVLDKGVGHLENTSLPVGGTATHAVLSAHTAYPTAKFFDDLTELDEGDVFYLTVLDEILEYQVDQIKIVEPTETSDLVIDRNEDYVTLVTCTPYGVNSHRLLVRGTRIPYDGALDEKAAEEQIEKGYLPYIIAAIILLILIIMTIVIIVVKKKRRRSWKHE